MILLKIRDNENVGASDDLCQSRRPIANHHHIDWTLEATRLPFQITTKRRNASVTRLTSRVSNFRDSKQYLAARIYGAEISYRLVKNSPGW